MASAARNQQIREAYSVRTGSKLETFKQVNEGARFEGIGPKDKNTITMAEVRKWYLEKQHRSPKNTNRFQLICRPFCGPRVANRFVRIQVQATS